MKLNLGCGDNLLEGYVNIDKYDKAADVQADICELPYEDGSVDEIVAYQVIEHIPYNLSQQLFDEMFRVLKVDGFVKLETPDIDIVCKKILEEGLKDKWIYNLVGEYYRPWDRGRYQDWDHNAASIHRNPWNFERIVETGTQAGFSSFTLYKSEFYPQEENLAVCLTK